MNLCELAAERERREYQAYADAQRVVSGATEVTITVNGTEVARSLDAPEQLG